MTTSGQDTVIVSLALVSPPSYVTVAVLSMSPQLAAVVSLTIRTLTLTPAAKPVAVYLRTPESMDQPMSLFAASMDHVVPGVVGSGSLTATLKAAPAPVFLSTMSNATPSVALTDESSATLVSEMAGQSICTVSPSVLLARRPDGSLVDEAVAVFTSGVQAAGLVGPETWIVCGSPGARSPKSHESLPAAMPQSVLSVIQVTPAGSTSSSVTAYAVPTPMFSTVIVNAAVSPALIGLLSAVFVTWMSGQSTAMSPSSTPLPPR